ncbi:MAG: hypothetical protein WCK96_06165 [Methylococcales bacterium]
MKVFYYSNYFAKNAVIPAWMLESSHRESIARVLISYAIFGFWIAAVHAAMT